MNNNTPDTEVEHKQNCFNRYGVSCLDKPEHCVIHDHTPDTELEVLIDDVIHDLEALDFNSVDARNVVQKALSSRDTYWKEMVRKGVEGMRKELTCHSIEDATMCEDCQTGLAYNQALDTLLDNLK